MEPNPPDEPRHSKGRPKLPNPGETDDNTVRRSRVNKVFGMKLRLLRAGRNLSQSDLSHEVERTIGTRIPHLVIGRIERGRQGPTLQEVMVVYKFFGCDLEWLIDDEQNPGNEPKKGHESYLKAIDIMRQLDPREAIRRLVQDNRDPRNTEGNN